MWTRMRECIDSTCNACEQCQQLRPRTAAFFVPPMLPMLISSPNAHGASVPPKIMGVLVVRLTMTLRAATQAAAAQSLLC